MRMEAAGRLFPEAGGIVIGERYPSIAIISRESPFAPRAAIRGVPGGRSPLLCFDGSFGSSHGMYLPAPAVLRRPR